MLYQIILLFAVSDNDISLIIQNANWPNDGRPDGFRGKDVAPFWQFTKISKNVNGCGDVDLNGVKSKKTH